MTEHELLEKLKQSAEYSNVPKSLAPSSICQKLDQPARKRIHHRRSFTRLSSAAAILLFCFALSGVAYQNSQTVPEVNYKNQENESIPETDTEHMINQHESKAIPAKKHNAGSLFKVADSYQQVYDLLESYSQGNERNISYAEDTAEDAAVDVAADGSATDNVSMNGSVTDYASMKSAATDKESSSMAKLDSSAGSKDTAEKDSYSKTNLQTEGVDESDIVKTDGRYIYTTAEQKIFITDTAYGELKNAGIITPPMNPSDSILELYVDNQTLQILVQHYTTILENYSSKTEETQDSTDSEDSSLREPGTGFIQIEDYIVSKAVATRYETTIYTYDITDPSRPVLSGSSTQEGTYQTSRKINDIIYLFTEKRLSNFTQYKSSEGGIIPCVNGEKIPCDHIYIPNQGNEGLIISSINQNEPDKIIDHVMIVNDYANVYVGPDSLYLYFEDHQNDHTLTNIAKFSIQDGIIDAVGSASVKGNITDTFAIHEYNDTLRVLTTSWDDAGGTNNYLYLLDETLKLTGSLNQIAKGEEIYAARYLNDTAYFITYRNTDPLFAADLSDCNNPVLIGQVEITGFSEYLHIWDDNKLLGIGYETDPATGEQKGLKLVMFDITDPFHLEIKESLALENYYYSPALYDYKCVLPDSQNNLIGFTAEQRSGDKRPEYLVYSWENGQFTEKLKEPLPQNVYSDAVRGLLIDHKFYIAGNSEIICFDMNNNFKELKRIQLQ